MVTEPTVSDKTEQQAQSAVPTGKHKRDFVSAGERIHNEITYRGVDLFLNTAAAVAFAVWSSRTHTGQKYFLEPVKGFFRTALKPFFKTVEGLEKGAGGGASFISIMFGGTAIIPPIMFLEDAKNKKNIVHGIDNMVYGKDKVDNDPKFAAAYQEIEQQPKKDFGTGMIARLIVLAPLIYSTINPKINGFLEKNYYSHLAKGSKTVAEVLHIKPGQFMQKIGSDGKSNWEFLHNTIAFDLGLTAFYSVLHEFVYKSFARSNHNRHEKKAAAAEAHGTLSGTRSTHADIANDTDRSDDNSRATTALEADAPATRLSGKVEHLERLAAAPQLQQAGA
jgi:hypothetical protein